MRSGVEFATLCLSRCGVWLERPHTHRKTHAKLSMCAVIVKKAKEETEALLLFILVAFRLCLLLLAAAGCTLRSWVAALQLATPFDA